MDEYIVEATVRLWVKAYDPRHAQEVAADLLDKIEEVSSYEISEGN